jgi:hypothetical protein
MEGPRPLGPAIGFLPSGVRHQPLNLRPRPLELHHAAPLIQPPYRRLQLLRREHPGEKQKSRK